MKDTLRSSSNFTALKGNRQKIFTYFNTIISTGRLCVRYSFSVLIAGISFNIIRFRNFVANLAVVDIVCRIVLAFMGYINVENNKKLFSFRVMTYSAFAFYGSFGVMVCALVSISLSRVIALNKPHLSNRVLRLLETRQIALATFTQVIVPLICQVRYLFFSCLASDPISNGTVTATTQIGLAANPLLYSLITVTIIKQYRICCSARKTSSLYDDAKVALETNL
ncbi:unnamed protein product [Angiostrongylus costaricensis]|uniref:G protein-coupled receptor n=1 Tax=Angiostrongylus costaricensis TaxID=334426 RepID=A0A158PLE2_ANGCS|nr:unnamed protein product [Angiostrongylus costaricensis]